MKIDGWLGNRSRLPLIVILSLRSQIFHRRAPTILTIVAIAASVGLAASVEMATRSVSHALQRTTDSLVGSAQLEVSAGGTGIGEVFIDIIRDVPGVVSASPVIQRTFRISGGEHDGRAIRIVAIDLLYESEARSYQIEQGGFVVRDPLRLVAVPSSVVIASGLAERMSLQEGDLLHLRGPGGEFTLTVRGLLTGGLSDAFAGQIAVMDVFGLQELLRLERRVDRIDVAVSPDLDLGEVMERIRKRVGEGATVRRSSLREVYVDSIMGTLNAAVWTMALIGILLALFLTYAVTSLSVDRRIEELSLLRAAGMEGRRVSRLIVGDAVLLAAIGTVLGFIGAVYMSDPLVDVFSRASVYLEHMEIETLQVRPSTVLVALLVGVPVALFASAEPALRAARRLPLDVLQGYRAPPSAAGVSKAVLGVAVVAAMLGVSAWILPEAYPGGVRLVIAIGCGVIAVGAGASQLLLLSFSLVRSGLGRLIPRVGYLVGSSLLQRPVEASATIAVWAAVTGGLVAILSMISSISSSIDDYWVGLNGEDAILVFAQDPLAGLDRELIRRDTIKLIRATPGVLDVAEYYNIKTMVGGEEVLLESLAARVLAERSEGAKTLSSDPEATLGALRRGEIVMNGAFAKHFGKRVGDELTLASAYGPRSFRIGGVARAYAGPTGQLVLDVATFSRWFRADGAPQITIWTGDDRDSVLAEIDRRVESQALFFVHGREFQRHTALVMAKFNGLLLVPACLIGSIGVIAMLNLLIGNVVAKRRDLAIIRASGGTPGNIRAMVVLNGVLIGSLGAACGLALGYEWSQVASDLVAEALGYYVVHQIDVQAVLVVWWGALAVSLVSGIAPALMARPEVSSGISSLG